MKRRESSAERTILWPPHFKLYTEGDELEIEFHTHKRMDQDSSSWFQDQCALEDEKEVPF